VGSARTFIGHCRYDDYDASPEEAQPMPVAGPELGKAVQSLAMGILGFAFGYLLISQTYTLYPRTVLLQPLDMTVLFLVVVLVCVLASLLGILRALKVDPSTALGGGGG
jgi:hypothetical protein